MAKTKTNTHGGKRAGAGRKPHPLGAGVKMSFMVPERLWDALQSDAKLDEVTPSQAAIARLIRGKKRGREL